MSTEFYWVAVALVTVISAARLTRLATVDKFPPIKKVRDKYEDRADGTGWDLLTMCGYCFSFWATLLVVLWGWLSGVYGISPFDSTDDTAAHIWWFANGVLAASYLAAVFMAHDGDLNDEQTVVLKEDES